MNMARRAGRKVVFLGPSLAYGEARAICPDAEFLPPVRYADLYSLTCEPPGQALIIDGVFHDSTPVWHREILQLLQSGWQVLGAASMGALRALELEPYGMIGLGLVFDWYRSGKIEGDDEVALLHGVAEMDYQPLTLALVDVRYALDELATDGALTPQIVSGILSDFKCAGHEKRTRSALLTLVRARGGDAAKVESRLSDRGGGIKARDARHALRVLAGHQPLAQAGENWPISLAPPMVPEAVLHRKLYPLTSPPIRISEALALKAAQHPDEIGRLRSEACRRWFLLDWAATSGIGPDVGERDEFAARRAAHLAEALNISPSRWCGASGLRESELSEWMGGLAVENWLANRTARDIGIDHAPSGDQALLTELALLDWMRRHGVEAPPERRANVGDTVSWLVEMEPLYFGAAEFHPDVAFVKNLAANGYLARFRESVPT